MFRPLLLYFLKMNRKGQIDSMFGKATSHRTSTVSVSTARHMSNHELNMIKRSEYAREKLELSKSKLPFNPENHRDVSIPHLHIPRTTADPQSVGIGYGAETARAPHVFGKKKPNKYTSDDCFIGAILIPNITSSSAASTKNVAPGDSQWTGRKATSLEPLPPAFPDRVAVGKQQQWGTQPSEEEGVAAALGGKNRIVSTDDSSAPIGMNDANSGVMPTPPEGAPSGSTRGRTGSRRWTAEMWGHGGGGYTTRRGLMGK